MANRETSTQAVLGSYRPHSGRPWLKRETGKAAVFGAKMSGASGAAPLLRDEAFNAQISRSEYLPLSLVQY
jgi:hypothetical protein